MADGLDFSGLTDDQIVELAAALAHEALMRNPALAAAFEQALVTEKEKAEALARGAAAARARALQELQAIGQRAEAEQQRELLRQKRRDALAVFVREAARITGRPLSELTMTWHADEYGKGPHLCLNAGTTGRQASWHLVSYRPREQALRTSPGLRGKSGELLQWAREAAAAAAAIEPVAAVIQGIEL